MSSVWFSLCVIASATPCTWAQSVPAQPTVPTVAPLDLGFEAGQAGQPPVDWFVPMEGWKAELTDSKAVEGKLSARLSRPGQSTAPFGNLMRLIDAAPYQGRRVKLSAKIRVEGAGGSAQMWLRADRPKNQMGAFDNMGDRPILPGDWSTATIEADVDADALQLAIGFMSLGGATLHIDSVKLEAGGVLQRQEAAPPRAPTPRGLQNLEAAVRLLSYVRFFHPSDECVAVKDWDRLAVHVMEEAEPATDAADLAQRLQKSFAPIAPTLAIWSGGPEKAPPLPALPSGATSRVFWRHLGAGNLVEKREFNIYSSNVVREDLPSGTDNKGLAGDTVLKPLGGGLTCRLPVKIYADAQGTLPHSDTPSPWSASSEEQPKLTALNRSTRLAGVALCWGVMQHFYPYFDVIKTDWDAALTAALSKAAQDPDERSYLDTLSELIAKLHDGHGGVSGPGQAVETMLPLAFAWAGADLVVVGKGAVAPADIKIGDAVLSIDGKPLATCCETLSGRISAATEGWRRYRLLRSLALNLPTSDPCPLRLRHPDGAEYDVRVKRINPDMIEDVTSKKPEDGAELAPGILYFDLDGAETEALNKLLPAMEKAGGIVFDLRGYPGGAAYKLMQHLMDHNATSAQWKVPVVTLPDREGWEWNDSGRWQLYPVAPRLKAQIAFVTDGRAISYAESILGIVEAYKMGEIVGAATAGTNGNVNPFRLPGGYFVTWTGMKVLKHDGSRHHGVGIKPTVPVSPTPQGIAEGRDEVLEKAVEVLKKKIEEGEKSPK